MTRSKKYAISQMYADVTAEMEKQGVNDESLDPSMGVLALFSAEEIQSARAEATYLADSFDFGRRITGRAASLSPMEEERISQLNEARSLAFRADAAYEKIIAPVRRRTLLATTIGLTALLGGGFMYTLGAAYHEINRDFAKDGKIHVEGNQIFSANTLISDDSILPKGAKVPLLSSVPGIPDYGTTTFRDDKIVSKVVSKKRVRFQTSYQNKNVVNPVSPDLQLTGREYSLARQASARLLIRLSKSEAKPNTIRVIGRVSDELNGKLGFADARQQSLAISRANVAKRALKDEARKRQIQLPTISISGSEYVLSKPQISQLSNSAEKAGVSKSVVLSGNTSLLAKSSRLRRLVDKFITSRRGATYNVNATKEVIKNVKVTEMVEVEGNDFIPHTIPGEAILGFFFASSGLLGLGVSVTRSYKKACQKRASKAAQAAGFDIEAARNMIKPSL